MSIKLVVGLGNPGSRYDGTRHNIGRRVVDETSAKRLGAALLVPESFMNLSGHEVAKVSRKKGIRPDEILVVLDEFQIPLGQLKILKTGSDGGHNGLKSVIECLGTPDVPRLRIGIGPLPQDRESAAFVLERFTAAEEKRLKTLVPEFLKAVQLAVEQGMDAAMNQYNKREL